MDAELVLQRGAMGVVAGAQAAIRVDQELRHQEQADALRALGRVRQAGEDEMDDVVRHVVVAPGDEDLGAEDAVVVAIRHGAGAHGREVGTGLRLGQVHRAGPLAADHLRQVLGLQLLRAMGADGLHGAGGEQRAQREGQIGGVPHLGGGGTQHVGQALAAECRVAGHRGPAILHELLVGGAEALGRHHALRGKIGAGLVAAGVDRREHRTGELGGLLQHRIGEVGRGLGEIGQGQNVVQPGQFGQGEADVAKWRDVVGHIRFLS